jgi:3-deoxy-D-manno-octulosonic-acid transferase
LSLRSRPLQVEHATGRKIPLSHRFEPGLVWWLAYHTYRVAWILGLPLALAWLWQRGRREPAYRQHLDERSGAVAQREDRPVWMHVASLGELRGAAPLIRALCRARVPVRVTTLTAAGRSAAGQLAAEDACGGRLDVTYAPLELQVCVGRFIGRTRPRCVLMVENDSWPVLLVQARRAGLPLALVNAQYSERSLRRDRGLWGFRYHLFAAYDLVLAKSERHAARFRAAGSAEVAVVGETRFEVPLPEAQLCAAAGLAARWGLGSGHRPVFAVASAVQGEETLWLDALQALRERCRAAGHPKPLFVLVPRSPQRFDAVAQALEARGWRIARRSRFLDEHLQVRSTPLGAGQAGSGMAPAGCREEPEAAPPDLLLGDSLGEMFFYLALADVVAVGGSFLPVGSHNVNEPLALGRPVVVGPVTWTIEFPAVEALQAGVLHQVADPQAMVERVLELLVSGDRAEAARRAAAAFCKSHRGAVARHLEVLQRWMPP